MRYIIDFAIPFSLPRSLFPATILMALNTHPQDPNANANLAKGELPEPTAAFQPLENESYDALFKVVLIGDSGVGKTSVLASLTGKSFDFDQKATIGVEFAVKTLELENGSRIKLQIWDTAGQERYRSISRSYYRGAVAGIVVYDITDHSSFEHVDKWVTELRTHAKEDSVIMLIGNKRDLGDLRSVYLNEARRKAIDNKFAFIETSARSGIGVNVAFGKIAAEVYRRERKVKSSSTPGGVKKSVGQGNAINLSASAGIEESSSCC